MLMLRLRCVLACLLLPGFLAPLKAQTLEIEDLRTAPVRVQQTRSLLWEISGKDLREPSYLFGVLPKVPDNFFFLPPQLHSVIQACDSWMMEIDPRAFTVDHLYRGDLPVDSTLSNLLNRRDYQEVESFVRDSLSSLSLYKLQHRYPLNTLQQQFMSDYCLGFRYGQEPVSYEQYLYDAIQKPLHTLGNTWARTPPTQSLPFRYQVKELQEVIRMRKLHRVNTWKMLWAYRNQDLDAVWLWAKDAPDFGDNLTYMLEARNESWLRALPWRMQKESVLVVINAVQLPGEYGLLHQLRKAGYQLRPIGSN